MIEYYRRTVYIHLNRPEGEIIEMKKNTIALLLASGLFIVLLGAAIFYQSSNFLYAASAVPILIVMFLPDIKSSQYIKPSRDKRVLFVNSGGVDGPELFSIVFEQGYLNWRKKLVFFPLIDALGAPAEASAQLEVAAANGGAANESAQANSLAATALLEVTEASVAYALYSAPVNTISVLKFDLAPHRRRTKWIGIRLDNLKERIDTLSFSVDQVNRLVIHMEDIRDLAGMTRIIPNTQPNKNIGA
jgi:hypothetical protein